MPSNSATETSGNRLTGLIGWLVAATISWTAAAAVARAATPVDDALPFLAACIVAIAVLTRPTSVMAVPLLLAASLLLDDVPARLFAFGGIIGLAFCAGVVASEYAKPVSIPKAMALTVLATAMLRWIPAEGVLWVRESLLALLGAAIAAILGGGPFAIAAGVVTAFFTPAIPLKTLALPIAVITVSAVLRVVGLPRLRLSMVFALALAPLLLFLAWSGVVARALPLLAGKLPLQPSVRAEVNQALAAGTSSTLLEVPQGATALIVSGANVPRLKEGAPLGTLHPGGRLITIGDASDWGFLRLEHFYAALNPLPRDPAGTVRGFGYRAWIDASGRIPLPRGATNVRVVASPQLPPGASLQVEGFEMEER